MTYPEALGIMLLVLVLVALFGLVIYFSAIPWYRFLTNKLPRDDNDVFYLWASAVVFLSPIILFGGAGIIYHIGG